jgi:hypothetical protein
VRDWLVEAWDRAQMLVFVERAGAIAVRDTELVKEL